MTTRRMIRSRGRTAAATILAAAALSACADRPEEPAGVDGVSPAFHVVIGPACFRMTGGGRIDEREGPVATAPAKSTPDSRDFATFGFEARPLNCSTMDASGNITWVEHDPAAFGGGFTFHGNVTRFAAVENHYAGQPDPVCGAFSGSGRARTRDGRTFDPVVFTVDHACDEGEPGRDDHIGICLGGDAYCRAGILTGGNIQKHRLTGAAAR
jgi:hypothetical protein